MYESERLPLVRAWISIFLFFFLLVPRKSTALTAYQQIPFQLRLKNNHVIDRVTHEDM